MRHGFTMIELIIVISVIAIMAGTTVPLLGSLMEEARTARMQSELKSLSSALIEFDRLTGGMPYQGIGNPSYAYVNPGSLARWNLFLERAHARIGGGPTLNMLSRLSTRMASDPWGSIYYYHHYTPYANLDTVIGSASKDRTYSTWNGTMWNARTTGGDDFYLVVK
jgi:prepilin-type N-terminal cleavage/methylation domain-containing protein